MTTDNPNLRVVKLNSLMVSADVLRAIATEIDEGYFKNVCAAVLVLQHDDGVDVFGCGEADFYRSLALLKMGEHHLMGVKK